MGGQLWLFKSCCTVEGRPEFGLFADWSVLTKGWFVIVLSWQGQQSPGNRLNIWVRMEAPIKPASCPPSSKSLSSTHPDGILSNHSPKEENYWNFTLSTCAHSINISNVNY